MEWLSNPEIWVAFLTLTALEIVLGIDNIIFISILVSRLPRNSSPRRASSAWRWRWAHASCCCSRSPG